MKTLDNLQKFNFFLLKRNIFKLSVSETKRLFPDPAPEPTVQIIPDPNPAPDPDTFPDPGQNLIFF